MLRSYGRLLTSSPIRRYATAAIASSASDVTIPTLAADGLHGAQPVHHNAQPMGLAARQAALEASGYNARKAAKKLDSDAGIVPVSRARRAKVKLPVKAITKPSQEAGAPSKTRCVTRRKANDVPARLLPPIEQKHTDLDSFLRYSQQSSLNTNSTVYRGTHFEYTVAEVLKAFDFTLHRTGRANDLGLDLIGHWSLPYKWEGESKKDKGYEMPVLIQCKASKPSPAMVRELEGAYTGAPAGWRGDGVIALLACTQAATQGVRAAMQRSRWPLGVLQVTPDGVVKQFLWNAVAAEAGLEGLGVAIRYGSKDPGAEQGNIRNEGGDGHEAAGVGQAIGLTWMGRLWRPVEPHLEDMATS